MPHTVVQYTITVRYFAALREALGASEILALAEPVTVGRLRDWLIARDGAHAQALGRDRLLRCALNQVMADEATPVPAGAEHHHHPHNDHEPRPACACADRRF